MLGVTQTTNSIYSSVLGKNARGWKGLTPKPEAVERFVIEAGVEECTDAQGNSFQRKRYAPLFGGKYLDPAYLASGSATNPDTAPTDTTPAAATPDTPAENTLSENDKIRAETAVNAPTTVPCSRRPWIKPSKKLMKKFPFNRQK